MKEILFEITDENLETGLRGYPVGYCTTSYVDPIKGLFYRGKPVSELCSYQPEEVMYLLLNGMEGSSSDIEAFSKELKQRAKLDPKVVDAIYKLPREGHPMKLFSSAILILGMIEGKNDYKMDAINLIAKIPHLLACVVNHHAGWGQTQDPQEDLSYMGNFTQMLKVPDVDKKVLGELFRLFNILHYDHGGGNLSAFVGKAVASGLEDMYGSICASLCALAGPRHGRANQDCLVFVKKILEEVGSHPTKEMLDAHVRKMLDNKELIFGFGHAVLRAEDARATILYEFAQKNFASDPLVELALMLRDVVPKVLKENPKISNPYPNVDAISGIVLTAANFAYPEYYTTLFGLSRSVGIATQIVYERCTARNKKGTPIVRPKYIYKGS